VNRPVEDQSTLIICNAIIPPAEQGEIEWAALLAAQDREILAERHREFAGYGSIGVRPDADTAASVD
jgi:hypothetical protein